jgi:hypothetical protein
VTWTFGQRLRGNAPDLYASTIISSSQASLWAGVARNAIVSLCSSFASQLPQSARFSSAIALAPADRLQRFDVALFLGSVREALELDQILDRGDANGGRGQLYDLTPVVQQVEGRGTNSHHFTPLPRPEVHLRALSSARTVEDHEPEITLPS